MKDLQKIKEFFSQPQPGTNPQDTETLVSDLMKAYDLDQEKALKIMNSPVGNQIQKIIGLGYAKTSPEALGIVQGGGARTFNYLLSLEEGSTTFKKGDKVTYLGHPGEITAVNKEMTGEITYSVAYDKGQGRTKASNINPKSGAIKPLNEGNHNAEDFKPYVVKDKNNPNFLRVFIQYPAGTGFTTALGQRTMTGQDREYGVAKAMKIGQAVAAKLESQYNIEDIDVYDNEDGKVIVFAVSDDFIKMNTPSIDEAKNEDAVDTITMDVPLFIRVLEYAREDAQADMDLHDLAQKAIAGTKQQGILSMDDYDMLVGELEQLTEANVPSNIAEFAKRKGVSSLVRKVAGWAEKVGARIAGGTAVGKNYSTLVLDLDYKQQGEIRIDTDEETVTLYDEPVYDFRSFERTYIENKELNEGEEEQLSFISKARAKSSLKQFLSGKRDDGMGKFDAIIYGIDSDGKKHQIKYYNDLQNYEKFALGDNPNIKEGMGGEIDEKYFVKVSNRDARKAIGTYEEYRDNSDIKKYDDTLYASNTPSDIYDFYYDLSSQDIEIDDWNIGEDDDYDYDSEYEKTLRETIKFIKENNPKATSEEVISELKEIKRLGKQLNEELCEKGKRYIAARQAAGEKSSAYLSGRGVKVCNGSIEWPKKGKKK